MHLSENTKSNQSLWRNKERVLLANPPLQTELKEITDWTTVGQAKDIASSPNPLVKTLYRGRHWVWGPTRRRANRFEPGSDWKITDKLFADF